LFEALDAGVRVALGTDSRASNPDLDLLAEMRHVAGTYGGMNTQAILRMGTLSGAEALGRDAEVGSITPGKLANLMAIPLPAHPSVEPGDWLLPILALDERPNAVWLRGQSIDVMR
jgi:imidazolonepropionase-like amidohydrolase